MRIGLLSDEPPEPLLSEAYRWLAAQQREIVESYAAAISREVAKSSDHANMIADLYGDWAA